MVFHYSMYESGNFCGSFGTSKMALLLFIILLLILFSVMVRLVLLIIIGLFVLGYYGLTDKCVYSIANASLFPSQVGGTIVLVTWEIGLIEGVLLPTDIPLVETHEGGRHPMVRSFCLYILTVLTMVTRKFSNLVNTLSYLEVNRNMRTTLFNS